MGTGVAGVDTMVLIDQRLVPVFLGPECSCHIYTAVHHLAALVIEAHNGTYFSPA